MHFIPLQEIVQDQCWQAVRMRRLTGTTKRRSGETITVMTWRRLAGLTKRLFETMLGLAVVTKRLTEMVWRRLTETLWRRLTETPWRRLTETLWRRPTETAWRRLTETT